MTMVDIIPPFSSDAYNQAHTHITDSGHIYVEGPTYDTLATHCGEVVESVAIGDYEGDLFYLLRRPVDSIPYYALLVLGYGSCSGCDALESARSDDGDDQAGKAVEDLFNDFISSIIWHDRQEMIQYLHDVLDGERITWWSSSSDEATDFITLCIDILQRRSNES